MGCTTSKLLSLGGGESARRTRSGHVESSEYYRNHPGLRNPNYKPLPSYTGAEITGKSCLLAGGTEIRRARGINGLFCFFFFEEVGAYLVNIGMVNRLSFLSRFSFLEFVEFLGNLKKALHCTCTCSRWQIIYTLRSGAGFKHVHLNRACLE